MKLTTLFGIALLSIGLALHTSASEDADPMDISLFPQQNETRNLLDLSGIWKFKTDPENIGVQERWFDGLQDNRSIAVPGCWNEQFTDIRNYLGLSWYETETFVPRSWKGERIFVRVGSAIYASKVWINGQLVGAHEGGNLPFAFDISDYVKWNQKNRITISVENELKSDRVPTGKVPGGFIRNFPETNYDFFPYAGINRPVWIYSVPQTNIEDLTITTDFKSDVGIVNLKIQTSGDSVSGEVRLFGNGENIETSFKTKNRIATLSLEIPKVRLWNTEDPFLYNLKLSLIDGGEVVDCYTTTVGVRTISVEGSQVLLNGEPIFLKGFGKHIDFPIFGRATANPVMVKDFELMKWTGANSFRTSHYPYDEAYLQMADREGFLIINETPAVGLYFHGDEEQLTTRQKLSKQYIRELITRDKNHPSVIMWCVANEPFPEKLQMGREVSLAENNNQNAGELLAELTGYAKELDPSRLVTFTGVAGGPTEWLACCDVVSINRYWGWYTHPGDLASGVKMLSTELDSIHDTFGKPVILAEFGADTISGFHGVDAEMFSEEFQVEFLREYLDVMDSKDYVVGAHVWNFADFKTGQGIIRVGGKNLKGVFTRDREPKMAAHYLRARWKLGLKDVFPTGTASPKE